MTISTTASRISYNGNGATVAFSFPYRFLLNSDLVVVLRSSAGVETILVLGTHYTLTVAGSDAGGTVTMVTAPAVGDRLVIYRDTAITQETDYISGDPFPAETHERALDRLTIIAQEQQDNIDRILRFPVSDTVSPDLPTQAVRANKLLAFDSVGRPTVVNPSTDSATDVRMDLASTASGKGAELVGFKQAGAGAVDRTVSEKLRDFVNAKDFGAVGDGDFSSGVASGTDNLAAFNISLAAAVAFGFNRVRVPAGNYYVSDGFTLPRGVTLEGDGTGHLPIFISGSNRRGTCLLINGGAGDDCLKFESNAGHSGLRDLSVYNTNANAIRSVVSVVGHLYPRMRNVEISSLRKTTGCGLWLSPSGSGAKYSTLWGDFHNVMVTITDVGAASEASVRYGTTIYGFGPTDVCNANSFVSGQMAGTWGGLLIDGDTADAGALSCVFHGVKFDTNWDGTYTPEYVANANGVFGWLKNNCYVFPVVHIKRGQDTAFHGCYFEAAGSPATYNDGTNGSHGLIAVFYNGGGAASTTGTGVVDCNWNGCCLYDNAAGTLVTPIAGRRYDTRLATHLMVYGAGVQSVPAYAWTKIDLAASATFGDDSFIELDAANDAVKVRSSGTYLVTAQVEYAGWATAGTWAACRINSDAGYNFVGQTSGPLGAGNPLTCQVTATMNLERGQSVWLESIHTQGTNQNTSGSNARLNVVKIA